MINSNVGIWVVEQTVGVRLTGNVAIGNGVDLIDDNRSEDDEDCANTWRGNKFATKRGAGAACIDPVGRGQLGRPVGGEGARTAAPGLVNNPG